MINKLNDVLGLYQNALNVRAYRQQLLASNIANADTPNFKARDVDFKSALSSAMGGTADPTRLTRTSLRHMQKAAASPFGTAVGYRAERQSSVDGNTVNLDVERAQFAENAVRYEATLTFAGGTMRALHTAITGQ